MKLGGDPSVFAWAVALLYLVAAWQCWRAARSGAAPFWRASALLLLALGVNKQLDLQTSLLRLLRTAAQAGGWYAYRRELEGAAVFGALMLLAALPIIARKRGRGLGRQAGVLAAGLGLGLLALAIWGRAAGILHVGVLARRAELIHVVLEPGSLLIVLAGALRAARRSRRSWGRRKR